MIKLTDLLKDILEDKERYGDDDKKDHQDLDPGDIWDTDNDDAEDKDGYDIWNEEDDDTSV